MLITLQDLQTRFQASGVYTTYQDNTAQPAVVAASNLRLVVGFSKSGLFNRAAYIKKNDFASATRLYGPLDSSLEHHGSWFHRSINLALAESDILALNLLALNNEVDLTTGLPTANADVVDYRSFSLDVAAANGSVTEKLYSSYYNKQKFWTPDRNYLLATRSVVDNGKLFNLVNLSQTPCSFIITKSTIKGFDVPVSDWYANINKPIPAYLNPSDLISDYFLDVVCVNGNYGPDQYSQLATDPVMGKYFDSNGLITSQAVAFLSLPQVGVRASFTGCIIPGFLDANGTNRFIEDIINSSVDTNQILCAVDKKQLDVFATGSNTYKLDLVGHGLIGGDVTAVDFLSYTKKISQDNIETKVTTNSTAVMVYPTGCTITYSPGKITLSVTSDCISFASLTNNLTLGTLFYGKTTAIGATNGIAVANPVLEVTRLLITPTLITFDLHSPLKDSETATSGVFVDLNPTTISPETKATSLTTFTSPGTAGNKVSYSVNGQILGEYIVSYSDTDNQIASGLKNAINALTYIHGFTAGSSSNAMTVTAPTGSGVAANSWSAMVTIVGTVTHTTAPHFTGGIDAVLQNIYETTNNRFYLDGTNTYYVADKGNPIYAAYKNGHLTNGDSVSDGMNAHYIQFTEMYASNGVDTVDDFRTILKLSLFTDADLTVPVSTGGAVAFGTSYDAGGHEITTPTLLNIISQIGNMSERMDITTQLTNTSVRLTINNEPDIKNSYYLVGLAADNATQILTRITSIKRYTQSPSTTPTHIDVTTANPIKIYSTVTGTQQVERFIPFEQFVDRLNLTYLPGFTLTADHLPDGTDEQMYNILGVMFDTNLADAVTDPEMISFRYLVDTFNGGLETTSKAKWTRLAMKRQKCLALLNTPSFQQFIDSSNPRFTDSPTPQNPVPELNLDYLVTGGNLDENPAFQYTLPQNDDGGDYAGFFAPNLIFKDPVDGQISVPPAALVSNNFVRKFTSGGNPFLPTAGLRRGVLSAPGLQGVEYQLSKTQRGQLEGMGINPIYKKKDGTILIFGNETPYQKFRSALNNLHVRDMLITVSEDMEGILDGYSFEFEDDATRIEINGLLTNYLGNLVSGYGCIQPNYTVIFDNTNNPDAIMKENAGIVDVQIQPTYVTRRFINRITLTDNSASSSGFVAV